MKKIGVVLAGCGVYDGSEINETVITLLALDRAGATAVCMAPALVSKVLGGDKLAHQLTIGTDEETAQALTAMGATHVACPVNEFVVDKKTS